jgi:hypothetical protein
MTRLLAISATLLAASSLTAQVTVQESKDAVTVTSNYGATWKAVVDKTRGGTINRFHVPANGPNLVSERYGFFNLFIMADKPAPGQSSPQRGWSRNTGAIDSIRVSSQDGKAVAEIKGRIFTGAGVLIADYWQTYTFLADRVVLDCGTEWKFHPETRLNDSHVGIFITDGVLVHPARVMKDANTPVELPVTLGGGGFFPEGINYPLDSELWFKNGQRLLFRAVRVPAPYAADRRYIYEKPWHTEWRGKLHQPFDYEGEYKAVRPSGKGNSTVPYPKGPVDYRYELVVTDPAKAPAPPPFVTITSPELNARLYQVGEVVALKAKVTKADGTPSQAPLTWELFPNAGPEREKVIATGTGPSFSFKIPTNVPHQQDFANYAIRVTATDSNGMKGYDYFTLGIAPPYPPSPVIERLSWDRKSRIAAAATLGQMGLLAWGSDDRVYAAWSEQGRDCAPGQGDSWIAVDRRWAARPAPGPACAPADGQPRKAVAQVGSAPPAPLKAAPLAAKLPGEVKGIISVNGVLYAWVVTQPGLPPNIKLAWSEDRGETWKLSEWSFPDDRSIFYPVTFVDYGRDSTASPDDFLYLFGGTLPKGTGPCFQCQHAYLARVRKDKIRDRDAYEFFLWPAEDGSPKWTRDGLALFQVLYAPDGIEAPVVTYHPKLKRYLAAVRSGGRLKILDAPQPWGPWYTVPADELGASPAVLSFPSRWLSQDGNSVWALFTTSGRLASEAVRATIALRKNPPAEAPKH